MSRFGRRRSQCQQKTPLLWLTTSLTPLRKPEGSELWPMLNET